MNRRLLMVGAGNNQVQMILRAKAMGIYTVAADGNPQAAGFAHADAFEAVNITDGAALTEVARRHRVDAIYPAAEFGVEAAAVAATQLGLPGASPQVATSVRDKHTMRQTLRARGVPTPDFRGVRSSQEAVNAAQEIGFPVIVKPADAAASRGVLRVDRVEEVKGAFQQALPIARNGIVLIEAFLEGQEFGVDGLVYNGQYRLGGITEKIVSPPPSRFDLAVSMPPRIPQSQTDAIVEAVTQALAALGFTNGTTHVEVIVTPEGPRIVEMAGRPGGGRIPTDLIPLAHNIDYSADSLRIALGEAPRETGRVNRGSCIYWITAAPGRVTGIQGIEDAKRLSGVTDVVLVAKPGDILEPIVDCATRDHIGYAIAGGATPDEAIHTAREACALVRIQTTCQ